MKLFRQFYVYMLGVKNRAYCPSHPFEKEIPMNNYSDQKNVVKSVFEQIPTRRDQWLRHRRHTALKLIRFS
jgi:hypothetical protein